MKGRCFCGTVRYELTTELQESYYCHCRDCQYLSGSPFHVLGIVSRDSIRVLAGEVSQHESVTQKGAVMSREFCTVCGTPLFMTSTRFEDIHMFTVTTLDHPEIVNPAFEIWTASKVSWANIEPDICSFAYGALDGVSD